MKTKHIIVSQTIPTPIQSSVQTQTGGKKWMVQLFYQVVETLEIIRVKSLLFPSETMAKECERIWKEESAKHLCYNQIFVLTSTIPDGVCSATLPVEFATLFPLQTLSDLGGLENPRQSSSSSSSSHQVSDSSNTLSVTFSRKRKDSPVANPQSSSCTDWSVAYSNNYSISPPPLDDPDPNDTRFISLDSPHSSPFSPYRSPTDEPLSPYDHSPIHHHSQRPSSPCPPRSPKTPPYSPTSPTTLPPIPPPSSFFIPSQPSLPRPVSSCHPPLVSNPSPFKDAHPIEHLDPNLFPPRLMVTNIALDNWFGNAEYVIMKRLLILEDQKRDAKTFEEKTEANKEYEDLIHEMCWAVLDPCTIDFMRTYPVKPRSSVEWMKNLLKRHVHSYWPDLLSSVFKRIRLDIEAIPMPFPALMQFKEKLHNLMPCEPRFLP